MKGDLVPDTANVVRYIRSTGIHNGVVNGSEFCLRADHEKGLSVNWLETFADLPLERRLSEVRRCSRLTFSKNGKLARLNVGRTKAFVAAEAPFDCNMNVIEDPLPPELGFPADPSHALIVALPAGDGPEAETIGDLIAACVEALYPAREYS